MKNLIFVIAFMLIANLSFAQEYYPQPELNKFAGTWEYNGDNQTFKIVLEIKNISMRGIRFDVIEGDYLYLLNSKEVGKTQDSSQPSITNGIIADKEKSLTKLRFLFHDFSKNKLGNGYLELIPGKNDDATWTLMNRESIHINSKNERRDYSFSVPDKLLLHKIR